MVIGAQAQINTNRLTDIGRNALYFEDYVVAIQYFNQVIKVKPYLAEPYFYRAYAKMNLEDWHSAIEDCDKALEINPFLPKVYYCRGYALRMIGERRKSTADLGSSLKFDPNNIGTTSLLIDNLIEDSLYTEAQALCDTILRKYPHHADLWIVQSQIQLAVADTTAAIRSLDQAVANNKYADLAYAMRGHIRYLQADYPAALSDLDKAISINAFRADYFGHRAIIRMSAKNLRGAMQDFNESIALDNRNAGTYFNRGLLRFEVGEDNLAIEDFTTCLALDPNNDMAYLQRAQAEMQVGQWREAIDDYNVLIGHFPDFVPAWYGRAHAKRMLRDRAGADRDEYTARQIEEEVTSGKRQPHAGTGKKEQPDPQARAIVGDLNRQRPDKYKSELRGQVQYKEIQIEPIGIFAVAVADSTLEFSRRRLGNTDLSECNRQAHSTWGFCIHTRKPNAQELEGFFRKIEALGKRLKADSTDWAARWHRALLFEAVQDYESAYADECRLIDRRPECGLFRLMRGNNRLLHLQYLYGDEEWSPSEMQLAEADFREAHKLDPSLTYALYNQAWVALKSNQPGKAVRLFEEALQADPELAEAYYNLGLILISQGDKERGRTHLSKAGELGIQGAYNVIRNYAY